MHPLFGSADPHQYPGSNQGYQQQQANYGGQQFAPMPTDAQQSPPTGFYAPPEQHHEIVNQSINYQNFQNIPTQQQPQGPRQTMSPPVVEPPKQKLPLPEEFIYMQTVLEELKTQCISAAGNPVS